MSIQAIFRAFLSLTPFTLLLVLLWPLQLDRMSSLSAILSAYWFFSFYPRKYINSVIIAIVLQAVIIFWPILDLLNSEVASSTSFAWIYMMITVVLFTVSTWYVSRARSSEEELGTQKMALASGFTLENFRSLRKNRIVTALLLMVLAFLTISSGGTRWSSLFHVNTKDFFDWLSIAIIILFAFVVGYYGMGKNILAIKKILLAFLIAGIMIGALVLLIFLLNGLLWFQ
jgi:hypothetical protein